MIIGNNSCLEKFYEYTSSPCCYKPYYHIGNAIPHEQQIRSILLTRRTFGIDHLYIYSIKGHIRPLKFYYAYVEIPSHLCISNLC